MFYKSGAMQLSVVLCPLRVRELCVRKQHQEPFRMIAFSSFTPRLSGLSPDFWMLMTVAALVTVMVGLLLIACRRPLSRMMRARDDMRAVQASHVGDPLRLGGVAIFIGLAAGAAAAVWQDAPLPALLILSAGPALLAGLGEDLGFCVSPLRRLGAAAVSALIAVLMLGVWVSRADLPGLDPVMAIAPAAVLLTVALS